MNRLNTSKRKAVIASLVEGMAINVTVRTTGVSKPTILKLLRHLGVSCAKYHDEHVRGLRPEHDQTNEIWSFNYCKAKNVETVKAQPEGAGSIWTWTAIDADSMISIA